MSNEIEQNNHVKQSWNMNVKFSKGPSAISKHKSEDIEKNMGRIKKT